MSALWITIVGLTLGTIAIRAAGPVLLGGRELSPRVSAVIALIAPAVLAALVVTQTFSDQGELTLDPARVAGLGAAAVALLLRAPLLLAVALAAGSAAGVRALTG